MDEQIFALGKRIEFEMEYFKEGATSEMTILIDGVERVAAESFIAGTKETDGYGLWNNNACLGYAMLGAKRLGYTNKQVKDLLRAINSEFDFKTVGEAAQAYCNSSY